MHPFNYNIPTVLDFDPADVLSMRSHPDYLKSLETIGKEPHEIVTSDLVNWARVSSNRRSHVRYLKVSPYATIWDYIEPPLGSYYWQWSPSENDEGLGRLMELNVDDMIPLDYGKWQWDIFESRKIERYRDIFSHGFTVSTGNKTKTLSTYLDPLRVYKVSDNFVVIDGVKRLLAARLEKVPKLKAWVIESKEGYLFNRSYYRRCAQERGLNVPEDPLVGLDCPAPVPILNYRDFRKMSYPAVHTQLDIVLRSIATGDKSELVALMDSINEIKRKFPKS